MNIKEFNIESERTMSDMFHLTDEKDFRLLHGAIGIVTEIGEIFEALEKRKVDIVNIGEEVTDVYWYLAIFQREYAFEVDTSSQEFSKIGYSSMENLTAHAFVLSSNLLDKFKKKVFYNKTIDWVDIFDLCQEINYCMMNLLDWINVPMDVALRNNIAKLKVRFPDKFSSDDAITRNLDAERKELEK